MTRRLQVAGLGKRFGGFVALDGIDLEVRQGERLGLIGPNGSGKSTFVKGVCGTLQHDSGRVRVAAEAAGVPTLRLKLVATTLSGGFMGMAGAPLPYYVTYLDPTSGFSLNYAVNAIAMPLIGGTGSWLGPVIGAVLVGGLQEYLRVTISSAVNVLVAGVLMVAFVIIAPNGIVGLVQERLRAKKP